MYTKQKFLKCLCEVELQAVISGAVQNCLSIYINAYTIDRNACFIQL